MRRLILFLVRLRLGVKMYEEFVFTNQRHKDVYYFCGDHFLRKDNKTGYTRDSDAGLNWLLSDECKIKRV